MATPIGFFTNLAKRFLQSEANLKLTHIQIYPTNQYTPAVHRLLQVAANLYDATTNRPDGGPPYLPTVFQPVFTNDGGTIFIAGFVEVTNTDFLSSPVRDLSDPAQAAALQPNDLVYGLPLVVGTKKGFPSFNEFSMNNIFEITRKVEFTRPIPNAPVNQTNVMYVLSVTNFVGVELWNSYRSNYTRPVDIYATNYLTMTLTNDAGVSVPGITMLGGTSSTNVWAGYGVGTIPNGSSFVVLLSNSVTLLPNSVYRFNPPHYEAIGTNTANPVPFEAGTGFPVPQWGLLLSNRLQVAMVDHATGRLVDYVQLNGLDSYRNLSEEIRTPNNAYGLAGLWNTNRLGAGTIADPTWGVMYQILISLGQIATTSSDWNNATLGSFTSTSVQNEINDFKSFLNTTTNSDLAKQVPFTPTRRMSQYLSWQANDPLVHYLAHDLMDLETGNGAISGLSPHAPIQPLPNLGRLNTRYKPWGGNSLQGADANAFNLAIKDPLVFRSDDWDFPEAQPLSFELFGRIHRGTPWQTVFLKSANILTAVNGLAIWKSWIGNPDANQALLMVPSRDWRLASLLISILNTNSPRQLLSVNEANTNAWSGVLAGITVLSNTASDSQLLLNRRLISPPPPPSDTLTIQAGSPQVALIADAITQARTGQPGQHFFSVGDILVTPELSVRSPWLNQSSSVQVQLGITDEAYEEIPSQLLPRLRPDPVGSIVQSNGHWHVLFTAGFDGYPYAVEASKNLVDWTVVSTNYPLDGFFSFVVTPLVGADRLFYRSVLLP